MPLVVYLLLVLCFVLAGPRTVALAVAPRVSGTPNVTADIQIGFGGHVVPDVWIPAFLILRSDRAVTGTIEVMTVRTRPPATERVRVRVHLLARTPHPVTVPVIIREIHAPVAVRLLEGETLLAEWRVRIPPIRLAEAVILALSDRPIGLGRILGEESRTRIAYVTEEDLPTRWQMYEGVRAIVIRALDDRRVVPTQVMALAGWVAAGGRIAIVAPPPADILSRTTLRPFLEERPLPPAPAGKAEQVYPWGRGQVTVVSLDPFRPDLEPETAAIWTRLLTAAPAPPLVDRTLLEVLPGTLGASPLVQLLIVMTLGAYLALLRPITRGLQLGRPGWLLAAGLLGATTLAAAILSAVVRQQSSGIVQGAVAEVLLAGGDLARIDTFGHIVLPRGGAFRVRSTPDTLIRPLSGAETTLVLAEETRLEGRGEATLAVHATALGPLVVRGFYRKSPQGVEVEIDNRTGRMLRDPQIFLDGRVQPLPSIGERVRATLSPFHWREPPSAEAVRGARGRLHALAFSRLRANAIINPTIYMVAWLHDERGVLRWNGRPAAPLLIILPLSRAPGDAP